MRGALAIVVCVGCGRIGFEPADGSSKGVFTVAAHVYDSCAILDGALSCWGGNSSGQLATGDAVDRFMPVPIGADRDWIAVAPGQDHICGLRSPGDVYCWGGNAHGQLGLGDTVARPAPTRVALARPAVAIAAWYHTCAILDDGELWCWGDNLEGELGQNDPANSPDIPSPIQLGAGMSWSQVAAGQGHTLAVSGGALYGTGRNSSAELGLGGAAPTQERVLTAIDPGPWTMGLGGQNASCGLRGDATIACWGANNAAELGTGDRVSRNVPTAIGTGTGWSQIDLDTFHSCALSTASTVSCWGRNVEGQLGVGDTTDRLSPTQSGTFNDWLTVSVARFHTCGMRADHSIWCVGQNTLGQLGITGPDQSSWVRVL
jgi:alpha-tubulin suppressor-like RCC1 family protein